MNHKKIGNESAEDKSEIVSGVSVDEKGSCTTDEPKESIGRQENVQKDNQEASTHQEVTSENSKDAKKSAPLNAVFKSFRKKISKTRKSRGRVSKYEAQEPSDSTKNKVDATSSSDDIDVKPVSNKLSATDCEKNQRTMKTSARRREKSFLPWIRWVFTG